MDVLEFMAIAEAMSMRASDLLNLMREALPDSIRL